MCCTVRALWVASLLYCAFDVLICHACCREQFDRLVMGRHKHILSGLHATSAFWIECDEVKISSPYISMQRLFEGVNLIREKIR